MTSLVSARWWTGGAPNVGPDRRTNVDSGPEAPRHVEDVAWRVPGDYAGTDGQLSQESELPEHVPPQLDRKSAYRCTEAGTREPRRPTTLSTGLDLDRLSYRARRDDVLRAGTGA